MSKLITDHIDIWTSAIKQKSTAGRGANGKIELYGIKKLRELILELAVRGKLTEQWRTENPEVEPASVLLEKIEAEKAQLIKEKKIKKGKKLPAIKESEKQFELPVGWEWVRLGTVGYTQTGGTPKKAKPELYGSDIPFIKPGDITTNGVIYDNEGLSFEGEASLGRTALAGSILMVCIGTIGKCHYIDRSCSFNQQINSITPFVNITSYLFRALSANFFQNAAWALSSSTTIAILNKGKWESILVPLPPLVEQKRIVAKVDELMALCDRLEAETAESLDAHEILVETLLKTLVDSSNADELAENWNRLAAHFDVLFTTESSIDQLKQTILQLAVMGKLTEKWRLQNPDIEPASVLLEKIATEKAKLIKEKKIKKQKPLPPITDEEKTFLSPYNWAWIRLDQLFNQIVDCPHSTAKFIDDGLLCLDTNSFKQGKLLKYKFRFVSEDTFNSRNKRLVPKAGDIVFAREGSVGESVVIPEEVICCLGQRVMLFRPSSLLNSEFLRLTISSPGALQTLLAMHKGIGAKHVNVSDMKLFSICLPPLAEQHRIVAKVDELMVLCEQLKERLAEAQTTQLHLADTLVEQAVK